MALLPDMKNGNRSATWDRTVTFFCQYLADPNVIGAIAPSSTFLARQMVKWVDLAHAKAVVEYGPGTGVFTDFILPKLSPSCKFFAIETNRRLAELFRQRHPTVVLYEDSVKNVKSLCQAQGISEVDCIISGLPWASFSNEMQIEFLDEMMKVLRPGGQFVTFAYLQGLLLPAGRRFRKLLAQYFVEISRSKVVWLNLPPAFVYQCRR